MRLVRPATLALVLFFALALLVPAPRVAATTPSDVEIEVATDIFAGTGTFTATGPAVDDGVVCATGDVVDVSSKLSGQGNNGFNVQIFKEFTCDDLSGSFLVKLQVKIYFAGPVFTSFNWTVMGGDGAYVDLHGSGKGVGLPPPPDAEFQILDVYDGALHID